MSDPAVEDEEIAHTYWMAWRMVERCIRWPMPGSPGEQLRQPDGQDGDQHKVGAGAFKNSGNRLLASEAG